MNLPPNFRTVITPCSVENPRSGCSSTGMPRPLSSTVTEPSLLIVTRISDGVAGHRFVDRVVDDFVHEVVEPSNRRIADIHARPFANVLQIAQMLELAGTVLTFDLLEFRYFVLGFIRSRIRLFRHLCCSQKRSFPIRESGSFGLSFSSRRCIAGRFRERGIPQTLNVRRQPTGPTRNCRSRMFSSGSNSASDFSRADFWKESS